MKFPWQTKPSKTQESRNEKAPDDGGFSFMGLVVLGN